MQTCTSVEQLNGEDAEKMYKKAASDLYRRFFARFLLYLVALVQVKGTVGHSQ